jgi:hypothetical protein
MAGRHPTLVPPSYTRETAGDQGALRQDDLRVTHVTRGTRDANEPRGVVQLYQVARCGREGAYPSGSHPD